MLQLLLFRTRHVSYVMSPANYGSGPTKVASFSDRKPGCVVLQINYGTRTLERVYQLHSAAINCMLVSEGLCVTGSDDKYLRVWPLDFSDFLLEVSVLTWTSIASCNHQFVCRRCHMPP